MITAPATVIIGDVVAVAGTVDVNTGTSNPPSSATIPV
jgi:hypothetical protein